MPLHYLTARTPPRRRGDDRGSRATVTGAMSTAGLHARIVGGALVAESVNIVAISGSLRGDSSNLALLRAAARVAPAGVRIITYDGLGRLPHFNPDLDEEGGAPPASVAELRHLLIAADAVL